MESNSQVSTFHNMISRFITSKDYINMDCATAPISVVSGGAPSPRTSTMAAWSQIPYDLIVLIANLLIELEDFLSFSAVSCSCRSSWLSVLGNFSWFHCDQILTMRLVHPISRLCIHLPPTSMLRNLACAKNDWLT